MNARLGLVQGGIGSFGGQPLAASRLARLLEGIVEPITFWLEDSDDRTPPGVHPHAQGNFRGWRICSPRWGPDTTKEEALAWAADRLADLARREKVRGLHLHGAFDWPLASAGAAAVLDLPLVVSYRGSDLNLGLFYQASTLEGLFQAASVSTVLNPTMERLAHRLFRPRGPVLTVPNHVDPSRFSREPVDLPLPRPLVGCVAEFRRVTGVDLLLEAFSRLQARRPLSLLLVGPWTSWDAPYYSRILDRLPGRERLHRTGAVPHGRVLSYMAACDVMAFPSLAEGMPNKLLEAMASGSPVVASRVPGNQDLVEDGVHGRLFEPRDADDLERVLEEVLDDGEGRRARAERAREKVLREFTPERERQGWRECYRLAGVIR